MAQGVQRGAPARGARAASAAEYYESSPRPYPVELPEPQYPAQFETRRINHAGYLLWDRHKYYVSWSLQMQLVGLEEVRDGNWVLHFGPRALAVVDATTKKFTPIPAEGATSEEKDGKPKKRGQPTPGMGVGPITYPVSPPAATAPPKEDHR